MGKGKEDNEKGEDEGKVVDINKTDDEKEEERGVRRSIKDYFQDYCIFFRIL